MQPMEFTKVGEQVLEVKLQAEVSVHSKLGIEPIINGVGPATRLGGLALSENIWKAMQESNERSYRMEELHESAGKLIAEMIGAPASLVTSGASASLTLSTAACIAGFDRQMHLDLPFPKTKRVEVLVQRLHQDPRPQRRPHRRHLVEHDVSEWCCAVNAMPTHSSRLTRTPPH